MTTKENTGMYISVPFDLKEEFAKFARSIGTNPSNLLKILMKNTIVTRSVNISSPKFTDVVIEPLDTSTWGGKFNNKSYELTKQMSKLLKNRKGK